MTKTFIAVASLVLISTFQLGYSELCYQCAVRDTGDNCFQTDLTTNTVRCDDSNLCATFSFAVDSTYVPLVRTCVSRDVNCQDNPPASHLSYCNVCSSDLCNNDVFLG